MVVPSWNILALFGQSGAPWHLDLITNIQTKLLPKCNISVQKRTIMNKFRMFLFRISAETCLKMDYFAGKSPKSSIVGGSIPWSPFRFNDYRECAKTLLPLNIFGWCSCLAILWQNETYILCFLPLTLSVQKPFSRHWGGRYLSTLQRNSAFKKIGILLAT